MKTFAQFMEDIQASVASNATPQEMESGELYGVGKDYPKRKKKKIQESSYEVEKHNWSEHDHELWKDKQHLRPAIQKNHGDRTIYIGNSGDTHQDIEDRNNLAGHSTSMGMFHKKTRQFHGGSAIDSSDLMTKMQRIKKFGNEETEIERLSLEQFLAEEYS